MQWPFAIHSHISNPVQIQIKNNFYHVQIKVYHKMSTWLIQIFLSHTIWIVIKITSQILTDPHFCLIFIREVMKCSERRRQAYLSGIVVDSKCSISFSFKARTGIQVLLQLSGKGQITGLGEIWFFIQQSY